MAIFISQHLSLPPPSLLELFVRSALLRHSIKTQTNPPPARHSPTYLLCLSPSAVTLTTVGYGDLSAHKTGTKLFACVYILVGVAMVAAFLAQLVELLLDEQASGCGAVGCCEFLVCVMFGAVYSLFCVSVAATIWWRFGCAPYEMFFLGKVERSVARGGRHPMDYFLLESRQANR